MEAESALVLVVDDNEMNRDLLRRRLQRQQYRVEVAENGLAALEKMRSRPVDIVLLDIMMPVMDGFEVLARLKGNAEWRDVPVIIISAADDMDSIVRGIELGAEDYLPKPYNTMLLKARIGASLEKKQLRDVEKAYLSEMATLQAIDRELNASLDLERAMALTLGWALRQAGARAGVMGQVVDGRFHVRACSGYDAALANAVVDLQPAPRQALETRQAVHAA
ncbi:MAG: response regulator, partial [Anaerolineales bacterium]|nr:response regulator [Anaerolineales bacterium]